MRNDADGAQPKAFIPESNIAEAEVIRRFNINNGIIAYIHV